MTTTPNPTQAAPGRAKAVAYAADLAMKLAEMQAAYDRSAYSEGDRISEELEELPEEVSWRAVAWQTTTQAPKPDEYRILLSGQGPQVQITGELDVDNEVLSHGIEWNGCDGWIEAVPEDPAHAAAIGDFARMIWEAYK